MKDEPAAAPVVALVDGSPYQNQNPMNYPTL